MNVQAVNRHRALSGLLGVLMLGAAFLALLETAPVAALVLAGVLLSVLVGGVLTVRHMRRRVLAPLDRLTRIMTEVAAGKDYSRRMGQEPADEIGELVSAFNTMLAAVEQENVRLRSQHGLLESMLQERTRLLLLKQGELTLRNQRLATEIQERRKAEMIRAEIERINRHDLKSSLNLVTGYPELLIEMGGLTDKQRMYLEIIRDTGYRIRDQIRSQLDLFRMENGFYHLDPVAVDLVDLLRELEQELGPLLARCEATLDMSLDGRPVTAMETLQVMGERTLLATMLRNLLVNAVEASHKGEAVRVALQQGTRVRLAIRNREPVPEAVRDCFFDKYATHGKANGTGLGTYSAKLIAGTHGAGITLRTGDKLGTVVRIAFPSMDAAAAG